MQKSPLVYLQKYSSLIVFVVFVLIMTVVSRDFFTIGNLLNILRQVSINGLIAFGMTLIILTAGIDLSVGSILAFSGSLIAILIHSGVSSFFAVFLGLLIGGLVGACNGLIIAYGRVQPFIATLSTMTIFRGLTLVISQGKPISTSKGGDFFTNLGSGYLLSIPIPVYILFIFFVVLFFILDKTVLGRYVYALGGNERASFIAGVKNNRIKIFVYTCSGVLSACAGIILISRLNSFQPTLGAGFELEAIAAVVIGGTSLAGGRGRITGTLIGILIIGVLNNGLNLIGISSFYQQVVKGSVILLAVLLDLKRK